MNENKVILVGAGPGDPDLISVKGLKAIQQADAILYDALSNEELLKEAPEHAERLFVGKRCAKHSLKQADINILLYTMSRKYKKVVRLKGGDPYIFGRGHEEQLFLEQNGVTVEVIPGISSVTGLASIQQVPLTRRNISESFWVLTGTTKDHKLSRDIYQAVHTNATLVILMGTRKIAQISQLLIDANRSDVPMMIIENGSRENEKIHVATAKEFVKGADITGPGIIIIGEVVSLHPDFIKKYALSQWI